MALSDFLLELDTVAQQAEEAFAISGSPQDLEAARVEFLGAKSGRLKKTQKLMGSVDAAHRPIRIGTEMRFWQRTLLKAAHHGRRAGALAAYEDARWASP